MTHISVSIDKNLRNKPVAKLCQLMSYHISDGNISNWTFPYEKRCDDSC